MTDRPPGRPPGKKDCNPMELRRRLRDRAMADGGIRLSDAWYRVTETLADRVLDFSRDFPDVLLYGGGPGDASALVTGLAKVGRIVRADLSQRLLDAEQSGSFADRIQGAPNRLPVSESTFDLILMVSGLHWVDDLAGCFAYLKTLLKPNGVLLGCMPGAGTLEHFGRAMIAAELACSGKVSPRMQPFIGMRALAGMLQTTPFDLPVVDRDTIAVHYSAPERIYADLRGIGEQNLGTERSLVPPPRALFSGTVAEWRKLSGDRAQEPAGVLAQIVLFYLQGIRGDESGAGH